MSRLKEEELESLRTKTVEVLLELRRMYLANGASPLKHWDQLQSRLLSSARRCTTPDELVTDMMRGLQLAAPSSCLSSVMVDLGAWVRERGCAAEFLDLVEREHGLLLAMTRLASEKRRQEREDPTTGEMKEVFNG